MKYWPQQLNFAVFCATQGCGISCKIFDNGINLPPQIRAFYIFHVYFTVRRILYQVGGIQSMSVLPGDPPFNQFNNNNNNNNNNNGISGSISTGWLFACPMLTKFTIVKRLKDI